jgi:hypothetical protein
MTADPDRKWWVSEVGHWAGSIAPMVTRVKGWLAEGVFIPYPTITMQQMRHQKQHHQGAHAPHQQQSNPAKDHG